ncbi:MAG TPA: thioesterase family protein [Bacteroidia bacterium]|nr:thioesterase family protein [Bacteroidia bacterium]
MKHKTPIQLRFKDIDALGHVNNANHLTFFELARINYFRDLIGEEIDWDRDGMIVARVTVDFKQPVYFKDKLFVYTIFVKTGTTSFELAYELVREEKDGKEVLLSTGTSVIVCYSYKDKKPVPVPISWKEKMEKK